MSRLTSVIPRAVSAYHASHSHTAASTLIPIFLPKFIANAKLANIPHTAKSNAVHFSVVCAWRQV